MSPEPSAAAHDTCPGVRRDRTARPVSAPRRSRRPLFPGPPRSAPRRRPAKWRRAMSATVDGTRILDPSTWGGEVFTGRWTDARGGRAPLRLSPIAPRQADRTRPVTASMNRSCDRRPRAARSRPCARMCRPRGAPRGGLLARLTQAPPLGRSLFGLPSSRSRSASAAISVSSSTRRETTSMSALRLVTCRYCAPSRGMRSAFAVKSERSDRL